MAGSFWETNVWLFNSEIGRLVRVHASFNIPHVSIIDGGLTDRIVKKLLH